MEANSSESRSNLENELKCSHCGKEFNNKRNLVRHERRNHRLTNFECFHCLYTTKFKFQLRKHITNIHINTDRRKTYCRRNKIPFKCCLCSDYECYARVDMLKHYVEFHDVQIDEQTFEFNNFEEFLKWKNRTEFEECFKFTLASKHSHRKTNTSYYRCFRDGHYVPKGKGKRRLKLKGTNKTNSVCPCSVRVIQSSNSKVIQAIYIAQHVGHAAEVSRLTLTKQEKRSIAEQLSAQVPFDAILDSIRESLTTSEYKRIHLTTFKDLHNIRKSFGLDETSKRSKESGDSGPRPRAKSGNNNLSAPTVAKESLQPSNEVEVPKEMGKTWHEAINEDPTNNTNSAVPNNSSGSNDPVGGVWPESQISIEDTRIVRNPPDLNSGSLQSNDPVTNNWSDAQTIGSQTQTISESANFASQHHSHVGTAWQETTVINKDPCNNHVSSNYRSSPVQSSNVVEGSWHETQAVIKVPNNMKMHATPNDGETIVGWPDLPSHPPGIPPKNRSCVSSLHLNDPSQRSNDAIEDSWHDMDPSNDGSDLHHSNDAIETYPNDFEAQKEGVRNIFTGLIELVRDSNELELIKKALAPLADTIQSMRRERLENADKSALVPWWSKPY